mmetsp:Transcript_34773/g.57978  ORF Transcript_34773/g.57978 Transcript_34773/m.57978 type:complete len:200 (-) Transcript_34773:1339-1938(-)
MLGGMRAWQQAQYVTMHCDGVNGGCHLWAFLEPNLHHVLGDHWGDIQLIKSLISSQHHLKVRWCHVDLQLIVHFWIRHSVCNPKLSSSIADVAWHGLSGCLCHNPCLEHLCWDAEGAGACMALALKTLCNLPRIFIGVVDSAEAHFAHGLPFLLACNSSDGPQPMLCTLDSKAISHLPNASGVICEHCQALPKMACIRV